MFGVRLWHPGDRAALAFVDYESITAAIERRMADDAKDG